MARGPKKQRLDELLVARGDLPNLKLAQGWILAGKVRVNDAVITKPGTAVGVDDVVALRAPVEKYASRGGLKLESALARFGVSVAGKVVLDAGASTGGFTDCLLQAGAARVYAADVGFGQLRGSLAADRRVVVMERTNVSDLRREHFDPPIELATFDLSYLSAAKAAPILRALFVRPVEMIGLVKPLYEGVAQDDKQDLGAIGAALLRVLGALGAEGLAARAVAPSPIQGSHGAVEVLVHLVEGEPPAALEAMVSAAMVDARSVLGA